MIKRELSWTHPRRKMWATLLQISKIKPNRQTIVFRHSYQKSGHTLTRLFQQTTNTSIPSKFRLISKPKNTQSPNQDIATHKKTGDLHSCGLTHHSTISSRLTSHTLRQTLHATKQINNLQTLVQPGVNMVHGSHKRSENVVYGSKKFLISFPSGSKSHQYPMRSREEFCISIPCGGGVQFFHLILCQ